MEVKSLEIDPEVVDTEDVEMLSDIVMCAVNEALRNASKDKEDAMSALSGGLNIPGMF
jgi:DNA-binding protein YbaB